MDDFYIKSISIRVISDRLSPNGQNVQMIDYMYAQLEPEKNMLVIHDFSDDN